MRDANLKKLYQKYLSNTAKDAGNAKSIVKTTKATTVVDENDDSDGETYCSVEESMHNPKEPSEAAARSTDSSDSEDSSESPKAARSTTGGKTLPGTPPVTPNKKRKAKASDNVGPPRKKGARDRKGLKKGEEIGEERAPGSALKMYRTDRYDHFNWNVDQGFTADDPGKFRMKYAIYDSFKLLTGPIPPNVRAADVPKNCVRLDDRWCA